MKKKTTRFTRRNPGKVQNGPRPIPSGILLVECSDPRCGAAPGQVIIHHLGDPMHEPATRTRKDPAGKRGPSSDSSDLTSEGATSAHGTEPAT